MGKEILDSLMPYLVQAALVVLSTVLAIIGREVLKFVASKSKELEKKMNAQQYEFVSSVAESIYYAVEQQFKESLNSEKKTKFDELILKKIPYLDQDDIDHFREAVIGKIKSTKETSNKPIIEKVSKPKVARVIHADQEGEY